MFPRLWVVAIGVGVIWLATTLAMSFAIVNRPLQGPPVATAATADRRVRVLLGVFSARKYAALKEAEKAQAVPPALVEVVLVVSGGSQKGVLLPLDAAASDSEKAVAFFARVPLAERSFGCVDVGDAVPSNLTGLAVEASKWSILGTHVGVRTQCEESKAGCVSDQFHCVSHDVALWIATQHGVKSVKTALASAPFEISHLFLPWPVKREAIAKETELEETTKPVEKNVDVKTPERPPSVAVVTMHCASECKVQKAGHVPTTMKFDTQQDKRAWACRHGYKLFVEESATP